MTLPTINGLSNRSESKGLLHNMSHLQADWWEVEVRRHFVELSEPTVDVVEGEGVVELIEDVVDGGGLEAQVQTEVRGVVIVLRWQV